MRQLVYQVCYTRYEVSFCLWRIGPVLKHCKVPKYYNQDCSRLQITLVEKGKLISKKRKNCQISLDSFLKIKFMKEKK